MNSKPIVLGGLLSVLFICVSAGSPVKISVENEPIVPSVPSNDGSGDRILLAQATAERRDPERDTGLIAYTLYAWKTDEFDFSELGKIVYEYIPMMLTGELSNTDAEKVLDRGLELLGSDGAAAVDTSGDDRQGIDQQTRLAQKIGRLRGGIARSDKIKSQIFTCNLDGSNRRQLTFEGDNGRPDWSPDGKRITFGSMRNRIRWVGVMEGDGSNLKLLAKGSSPDWSPDGTQIAYGKNGQIWVMNSDGSGQRQITFSSSRKNGPSWSPDGKQMVFIRNRGREAPENEPYQELGIMNSDGTDERIFTIEDRMNLRTEPDGSKTVLETAYDANAPAWSPVDNRIAFWSGIEHNYGQIWFMNADGTDCTQVTADPSHRNSDDPSWSPDGSRILFSTARRGLGELWIIDADGKNEMPLFPIDPNPFPGRGAWQPTAHND